MLYITLQNKFSLTEQVERYITLQSRLSLTEQVECYT